MIAQKNLFSSLAYISLWTFSGSCCCVFAEPLTNKAGWDGELSFVAVGFNQQSQFVAEDDNRRNADLNNAGKTINRFGMLPIIRSEYTLNDLQTKIFVGNNQDNLPKGQFALELGFAHSFRQNNQFSFALFPKLPAFEKIWQDPFLTGQERQNTNEKVGGGRIKFEHQGSNPFDVQYVFLRNEVDVEKSGHSLMQLTSQQRAMLNRNADFHRFNVSINCPINQSVILIPSFQVTTSDAEGDANDFAEGVFKLQSLYIKDKHLLSATFGIGRKESSVDNPIFKLPQNDKSLSLDVFYKYAEPMGYKNLHLLGVALWKKSDANITFYSSKVSAIGLGLGYTW